MVQNTNDLIFDINIRDLVKGTYGMYDGTYVCSNSFNPTTASSSSQRLSFNIVMYGQASYTASATHYLADLKILFLINSDITQNQYFGGGGYNNIGNEQIAA